MSQVENANSCSPGEQQAAERVIHGAVNANSPRELVSPCLVRPVNNESMTNSPRELVMPKRAPLVVRPVNTLKALPGGARFLFAFVEGFCAFAPQLSALRSAPQQHLRLHPSHSPLVAPFAMSQAAPFNLAGRALHTGDTTSRVTNDAAGAGLQGAHLMHHIHRCTRFTTAVRHPARTARARTDAMLDLVKQLRGIRSETAYALAARGARCRQRHRVAASGYHNLLLAPAERRDK